MGEPYYPPSFPMRLASSRADSGHRRREGAEEEGMSDYRVWTCKIVVPGDAVLPHGFDWPPRMGATQAVEAAGIKIISCFSGWGGELDEGERDFIENKK